jgi:drug/metabolite transporter (DMT)-like permease
LLGIVFGLLVVSTASIAIRYAQAHASSLTIATWRLGLASLLLAPLLFLRERPALARITRRELILAMASGAFLAIHFITWIASLEHTTVASAVVLVSTVPLFVALLSPLALREYPAPAVWAGLALALVGTLGTALLDTCESPQGLRCPPLQSLARGEALLGDGLALAGALAGTGYFMIGRRLRQRLSLLSYIGLTYSAAAAVLLLSAILTGQRLFGFAPIAYIYLVFLAVGPQLLGHSSYNWALRYLPAAFLALTLLGEPVGSTILAYLFLKEQPSVLKLAAMAVILAGIAAASLAPAVQRPPRHQHAVSQAAQGG